MQENQTEEAEHQKKKKQSKIKIKIYNCLREFIQDPSMCVYVFLPKNELKVNNKSSDRINYEL